MPVINLRILESCSFAITYSQLDARSRALARALSIKTFPGQSRELIASTALSGRKQVDNGPAPSVVDLYIALALELYAKQLPSRLVANYMRTNIGGYS